MVSVTFTIKHHLHNSIGDGVAEMKNRFLSKSSFAEYGGHIMPALSLEIKRVINGIFPDGA